MSRPIWWRIGYANGHIINRFGTYAEMYKRYGYWAIVIDEA